MGLDGLGNGFSVSMGDLAPTALLHSKSEGASTRTGTKESPLGDAIMPATGVQSGQANLMAGHFASIELTESRYIAARKAALQSDSDMVNRQNSVLTVAIAELEVMSASGKPSSVQRYLIGKKAERRMREEQQRSAAEASESNLDEMKRDIKERAAEATRPDTEGNGQAAPPEATTSASTPARQTAAAAVSQTVPPSVPQAIPLTGAEAAALPATPVSSASVVAMEDAPAAKPTITSIDITV